MSSGNIGLTLSARLISRAQDMTTKFSAGATDHLKCRSLNFFLQVPFCHFVSRNIKFVWGGGRLKLDQKTRLRQKLKELSQ